MKKSAHVLLSLVLSAAFASVGYAQTELQGTVVEIVDGRTFVMEAEGRKVTATVKYVDVPEPEQPLSGVVREHLQHLILGKTITFVPNGFSPIAIAGKVFVNGVDLGQQLVRDGAAWHVPSQLSGQDAAESEVYDGYQILAKRERRGIWSIENLTPAWEFRSRREPGMLEFSFAKATLLDAGSDPKERRNYTAEKSNIDMWVEVGGPAFEQKNAVGTMFWGYDPEKKVRNTSTPSIAQVLAADRKRIEVEARLMYFQGEIRPRTSNTAYIIGILATSKEETFLKANSLSLVADGTTISLDAGQRFARENGSVVQELIQYRIGQTDLATVANAKKVSISVGPYTNPVNADFKEAMSKLLRATQ